MKFKKYLTESEISDIKTLISHYGLDSSGVREVEVEYRKSGRPKRCFDNSFDFVQRHSDYNYVLGYYLYRGIHIEHAWVEKNGRHFDITIDSHHSGKHFAAFTFDISKMSDISIFSKQKGVEFYTLAKYYRNHLKESSNMYIFKNCWGYSRKIINIIRDNNLEVSVNPVPNSIMLKNGRKCYDIIGSYDNLKFLMFKDLYLLTLSQIMEIGERDERKVYNGKIKVIGADNNKLAEYQKHTDDILFTVYKRLTIDQPNSYIPFGWIEMNEISNNMVKYSYFGLDSHKVDVKAVLHDFFKYLFVK